MSTDQLAALIRALEHAVTVLCNPGATPAMRKQAAALCNVQKMTLEQCAGVNHG